MARLADQLGDWLARVELLARGAEGQRADAARALGAGRPWEARDHALAMLEEVPRSRVALALWADAAEAMLLDHEALEALERLATELPFRADVWFRVAQVRHRTGADPREALLRATEVRDPPATADAARLWLADLDLWRGDTARAERWLDQLGLAARNGPEALTRRAEVSLALGDLERARQQIAGLPAAAVLDGRRALLRARLQAAGDGDAALVPLTRALLLEVPGALAAAAEWIAAGASAAVRAKLAALIADLGQGDDPLFRAAVASAEGREQDALVALAEGARTRHDPALIDRYLAASLRARDARALGEAVELATSAGRPAEPSLNALVQALGASSDRERLEALDGVGGPGAQWSSELRAAILTGWCPDQGLSWTEILEEIGAASRALGAFEEIRELSTVARDLDRPLRVAVVGEFNAGKSTLINALLGEAVAPVGVLPTTATLNHLVWAPDRCVRIERRDGPDRVVPHLGLERALAEIDPSAVERVTIFAPLELLRKVELIDTPGFNAGEAEHARLARAAFRDAHVALWLLDATQPLKDSERAVLAEIRRAGLPLVVLVNKLDRLGAAGDPGTERALAETLEHVRQGLSAASVLPEAPVVAFSARAALAGRAGDPGLLAASRFAEVERLVQEALAARSALLREGALRRRSQEIVARLLALAEAGAVRANATRDAAVQRRAALADAAAATVARRAALEREVEPRIAALCAQFQREVAPVAPIRGEPAARRFVAQRARVDLGGAWTRVLVEAGRLPAELCADVESRLAPRLQAVAAAIGNRVVEAGAESSDAELTLARELAEIGCDELVRVLEHAAAEPLPEPRPGWAARLQALGAALNGGRRAASDGARIPE